MLQWLVHPNRRTVEAVENDNILPNDTLFYREPLQRRPRAEWMDGAVNEMATAQLLFINPDTGIASEAMEGGPRIDREHVSIAELRRFWDKGKSLVIYQHWNHWNRTANQVNNVSNRLQNELHLPHPPRVLQWGPLSVRYYFIVPQPHHEEFLNERIEAFQATQWCMEHHFAVEQ